MSELVLGGQRLTGDQDTLAAVGLVGNFLEALFEQDDLDLIGGQWTITNSTLDRRIGRVVTAFDDKEVLCGEHGGAVIPFPQVEGDEL